MLAMVCLGCKGRAATYYVDPAGSNANDGLTPQTAWRTLLKVGISTFQPGDVVLFKRDAVWNEFLTPPSSGATGNPIKFDAYGSGKPPEFTGLYQTRTTDWTNTSGSVWQATLSATQPIPQLKFVRFGTIWGNSQAAQGDLAHDRDWYYDSVAQILYVWSPGGNPVTYYGAVNPIILSGQSLININGVSNIEIQHIMLDWYDAYGAQVQGASDHIWLANMVADSQVPNGAVPIGFYVHPSGTPSDIHIYNTDSNRNYSGYYFDGSGTYELTNCRAFANRTYGLVDNSGGVNYSYCHFYANNLATGISTDALVQATTQASNNIPADTPAKVRNFRQYPARITLTFDDPGLLDGPAEYIQGLLPMLQAKGVPLSIAVVTGYDLSNQLIATFQSWINGGWDVNCHSVSHQYFTFPNAFTVQYTGTASSSVVLTIANKQMTITAPGDPAAQVNWDLTAPAPGQTSSGLDTLSGVVATLLQRGVFAVTVDPNMKGAVKSEDLADAGPQDITNTPYLLEMDKTRLMTDELGWSMAWMNANLTGLPANRVYVYPGSHEDTSTEAIAVAAGYAGARGSGTMQPSPYADTVLADGYDVQNILSQGIAPAFQNLSDQNFVNRFRAMVFKSALWGVPFGIFWHWNELTPYQVALMIDTLKLSGATLMSNTQLVNYLLSTKQNAGTTNYSDSATGVADFRPGPGSPDIDAGSTSPGDEYKYDIMGVDQTKFGTKWEIGAYAYVPESVGHAK